MGRHTGPRCKLCRREKTKLFLKGERCGTSKCAIDKRPNPPGPHAKKPPRTSEYSLRLREKQKAERIYGLRETQFRNYFEKASKAVGMTGAKFLEQLERRLDNVVYRLGFAPSRSAARMLVRHGHFMVNGKKVNIPSYQVKIGNLIVPSAKSLPKLKAVIESLGDRMPPAWLKLDSGHIEGSVLAMPVREDIDTQVEEHLIVEFYSR